MKKIAIFKADLNKKEISKQLLNLEKPNEIIYSLNLEQSNINQN